MASLLGTAGVLQASPAGGVEGSTDPEDAPELWCSASGVAAMDHGSGDLSPSRYVGVWVPAGAYLRTTITGYLLRGDYTGPYDRAQYSYHFQVLDPDTLDPLGGSWWDYNDAGLAADLGNQDDWVSVGPNVENGWTNNTGESQAFIVQYWSDRGYAGAGARWIAELLPVGGAAVGPPECPDPSEAFNPR